MTTSEPYATIAAPAADSVAIHVSRCRDPDALDDVRRAAGLEVARHVDDAEVDPVADDDAEEKPGGRVQAADRVVREAEGPGHADADRQGHHDQRADPQEVEKNDAEDHRHADQADVAQVVLDVPVLFGAGDEIAGELHRDRRVEPFRVDLGDRLLDQRQDRGVPVEVPGGDGGADQDHDERPARLEIIAVDARRLAFGVGFLVFLQFFVDPLPRDLRRLIRVVESQVEPGRLGDLVFVPVDQGVAKFLDLLQGSVQIPVLPEKGVGFAGAGVDRPHLAPGRGPGFPSTARRQNASGTPFRGRGSRC